MVERKAFGVFDDDAGARRAAERLVGSGFRSEGLRAIHREDVRTTFAGLNPPLLDRGRLVIAIIAGTIPAALAGLATGMLMHHLGAARALAPLQAVVGLFLGAALGALVGAFFGTVWSAGTPRERALEYLDEVRHGATLLVVPAPRARLAARAAQVLVECGAREAAVST